MALRTDWKTGINAEASASLHCSTKRRSCLIAGDSLCSSGLDWKNLSIKQKTLLTEQVIYINKSPGALTYGGDKRDRTADLCGVNAAQPPEADMIKIQEVSGSYIPHKTKNPAPLSRLSI